MTLRSIAVLLVLAAGSRGLAADEMGIPTDGLDLVRLTDGRVVRCRVGPEDGGKLELNFPSASLLVPKARIAEIRTFRDYDSTPTNPKEEEYAAKGWVKWDGRWMSTKGAEALREKEDAPLRARRAEDDAHAKWENRWQIETDHFAIQANVGREALDYFAALLEDFYDNFTKRFGVKLTQRERKKKLPVFIFRNREEYWTFFEKDTGGESEHTRGYFIPVKGEEKLVLFDQTGGRKETIRVLFHEATHFVLHLSEPQVVLPRWLHEGVAEYYGATVRKGKDFVTGGVQDGRLLDFHQMIEENQLVPMAELMSSGNSYAREGTQPKKFGSEMYAEAWLLAHYLLEGQRGRYAKGFADYINKAITGRGGVKYTAISATDRKFLDLEDDQDLLRRCLKVKSLDDLLGDLKAYAKTLPLQGAAAYVERGRYKYWAEKNPTGAEADFAKALELGGEDPEVLVDLARAVFPMGRDGEARKHIQHALEIDPLDTGARLLLARLVQGSDCVREMRISAEIDPKNPDALGDLAWMIYKEEVQAPYLATTEQDKAAAGEALDLCLKAVAIDPDHRHLDTLCALYLALGRFEEARDAGIRAVQLEPEETAYLGRLATAHAALGEVAKCVKIVRRIELVASRPPGEGSAPPPENVVGSVLDRVVVDVVAACVAFGKLEEAAKTADGWWRRRPPVRPEAWYVYAMAHDRAGDPKRALEVARQGLEACPANDDLAKLVRQLEAEVK